MKEETITPRGLVRRMLDGAGISNARASLLLNRGRAYLNQYTTVGKDPSATNLVKIAAVCGYEVHIIGHGEDITVEAPVAQED